MQCMAGRELGRAWRKGVRRSMAEERLAEHGRRAYGKMLRKGVRHNMAEGC